MQVSDLDIETVEALLKSSKKEVNHGTETSKSKSTKDSDSENKGKVLEEQENSKHRTEDRKRRKKKEKKKRKRRNSKPSSSTDSHDKASSRSHSRRKKNKKHSRSRSRSNSHMKVSRRRSKSSKRSRSRSQSSQKDDSAKILAEKILESKEEAQRDDLTVLVLQLPPKSEEKDLYQFFKEKNAGKIRDIRIIKDPKTNRSKGLAYVEFFNQDSVLRAISLNGSELLNTGAILKIQPSQAEINRAYVASKQYKITRTGNNEDERDLYAGKVFIDGLNGALADIQETDLKELFSPFGEIDFIDLRRDPNTGRCKGYALLQYRLQKDAEAAILSMNNFAINDVTIKVAAQPHGSMIGQNLKSLPILPVQTPPDNSQKGKDLDYEESGGFLHNAQSRFLLMQKLTREVDNSSNQSFSGIGELSTRNEENSFNNDESPISFGKNQADSKYIKHDDLYSGAPVIQTAAGPKKVIPEANIYVKNLDLSLTIKQLESVFSVYGNILSCKIATDNTGSSLGYGYVQFDKKESADRAIAQTNNTKLKDMTIQVQPFISKINRLDPKNNLYIKNLPNNISEEELNGKLIDIFGRFGTISSTVIRFDKTANRPFGFICFEDHTSADLAIKNLQGKDPFGVGNGLYIGWAEKKPERVKRLTEMHNQNSLNNFFGYTPSFSGL